MIKRKLVDQIRKVSIMEEIVCDRCGNPAKMVSGFGVREEYPFSGAMIEARIYPTNNFADLKIYTSEICAECARELEEWIGGGKTIFPNQK